MKVYVVYALFDYATAMLMSVDENEAIKEKDRLIREGHNAWAIEYDFAKRKTFQLDCD